MNAKQAARYEGQSTIVLMSLVLYVAACYLPAVVLHTGFQEYSTNGPPRWIWYGYESLRGVTLLFAGLFGLLLGNFAVLANPLLWLSWLFHWRKHYRRAGIASAAALIVAMQTFQLVVQPFLFDEAGVKRGYLKTPHVGFVFWLTSKGLVLWVSIRAHRRGVKLSES